MHRRDCRCVGYNLLPHRSVEETVGITVAFLIVLEASYGACVIADFERAEETLNPVGSLHRPFQGSRFWCSHWDNGTI